MKTGNNKFNLAAYLLILGLTASSFTGCNKTEPADAPNPNDPVQQQGLPSDDIPVGEENGEALEFKPSELGMLSRDKYEFPYMGLTAALTQTMIDKMDSRDVILLPGESYNADYTIKYAIMQFYSLTEEQKNETAIAFDFEAWKAGLEQIGFLGVYHKDALSELDKITGCTNHKELGRSKDGNYIYYLSVAGNADTSLKTELEKTEITVTEMQKMDPSMGQTPFSEGRVAVSNVGDFKTQDINGKKYTDDIFKKYELTLVNVFSTWCSPCIQEMPELEKLKTEMNPKGVNVIAIVYDSVNENGKTEPGVIDTAKLLQEKADLTFPLLIPDKTDMNGRLKGIDGFPESFFVDKNGNIVGETYVGANSFENWKNIVEKELADLKGAN